MEKNRLSQRHGQPDGRKDQQEGGGPAPAGTGNRPRQPTHLGSALTLQALACCPEERRRLTKTQNHFLLLICLLDPEAQFALGSPLAPPASVLLPSPPASESPTIPGTVPARISRATAATIAVVWKSFLSTTASPHRNNNSWFRKIKFCYPKRGSC